MDSRNSELLEEHPRRGIHWAGAYEDDIGFGSDTILCHGLPPRIVVNPTAAIAYSAKRGAVWTWTGAPCWLVVPGAITK